MLIRILTLGVSVFIIALAVTSSPIIASALMSVVMIMIYISTAKAIGRRSWELYQIVPEVIDLVISGIQSGLSLNESMISLGTRGPRVSQSIFLEFEQNLHAGINFDECISELQRNFGNRAADQLFESLLFAKSLGGSELLSLLRQLGNFTRQDLVLRREIAAKQGWIKNSAHLSAAAPWLLLLLLSAQPSTAQAFSTSAGGIVLGTGVALTTIAYIWMGRLSRMPEPVRIYGGRE